MRRNKSIIVFFLMIFSLNMQAQYKGGAGDGYANQKLENKLPSGANIQFTIDENASYEFSESDFPFSDEDGYFSGIKIISLETNGDLEYQAVNVIVNEIVTDLSLLQFKTLYNGSGWPYASFSFKVLDNEGGLSSASYICTFYVIHNPLAQSFVNTINEDDTLYLNSTDFNMSFGNSRSFQSFILKKLPDFGRLVYNTNDAAINTDYVDISKLMYISPRDSNGIAFDHFTYQVKDDSGFLSDSVYKITINVTPMPDAPTGENIEITLNEDQTYYFSNENFPFSDIDSNIFAGIQITNLSQVGQLLYEGKTINQNDTITQLSQLSYSPIANGFGIDYDAFYFKVLDNSNQLSEFTYKCSFQVNAMPDAPISADTSIYLAEDEIYTFSSSDFFFSDIDNESLAGMLIESLPSKGELKYNNNAVNVSDFITSIDLLQYTPVSNDFGANYSSFAFKLKDSGGEYTQSHLLQINVSSVNDLPTSENFTKNIYEDIPYYFNSLDIKFNDIDSGDSLFGLYFTNLPLKGTLKVGEESAKTLQIYSLLDSISYQNVLNENGADYASIPFRIVDSNMGLSENSYTVVFHVNPSPDFPVGNDFSIEIYEDSLQNFENQTIPFSDPDGQSFGGLRIDSLPAKGMLYYDGIAIEQNTICKNMSLLSYLAPKDSFGTAFSYFYASVIDPTDFISENTYKGQINVLGVNDAPYSISLSQNHIGESKPKGSTIGTLSAQDIDSEHFTFKLTESPDLSDIDNKSFKISATSLLTDIALDYESQYLYFIRLGAFDDDNASVSAGFIIYIDDETENGIENHTDEIKLYPNPAQSYLMLENNYSAPVYFRIIKLNGQENSNYRLLTDSKIDVNNLSYGYYILEIAVGEQIIRKMFIKN